MASLRSPPRLRATLSIATCFVLASSAGYFSSALRRVLVAIAVWSPSAATSVLSRTSRKAWKSLKGDRPAGPTHGRSDLLRLSPWTFACARPPDAWRLPLVCGVWCWGFHPPVCAAPYPPGCGATSSLLLSNICIQLLSTLAAVRGWRLARRAGEGRAADGHLECRENRLCSHSKVRVHYAYDFYGLSPDLRLRVLASSRSTRRAPSYTSKYGSVRTPLAWGGAQG